MRRVDRTDRSSRSCRSSGSLGKQDRDKQESNLRGEKIRRRWQSGMMGPLEGVRIVELGGIGPAPMCAMLLADLGAEVLRVERRGAAPPLGIPERFQLLNRSRERIELD